MADRTIGELAEAPISSLPSIADLYDDSLLAVEQQGEARKMTGAQWKKYAQAGVAVYVESAKDAAVNAEKSAEKAANSAQEAAESASDAKGSADTAKQYSGKPPVIRDGRWWTWNTTKQEYVDTGEAARGNLMYATFYVDAATGELYMVSDKEYTGPQFRLADGDLEVVLNYG